MIKTLLAGLIVSCGFFSATAQDTATYLESRVVLDSLNIPWDLDWGPDNRIWFSERYGRISRIDPDNGDFKELYLIDDVYLSIDNSGLHAFALHPDFPVMPFVYAHYTFKKFHSRLIRLTYNMERDTLTSPKILLESIPANNSHNGSRIIFDDEGYMYLATGDAYDPNSTSQDIGSLGGKILRMHEDGSIPADNPYDNLTWSWGHRNPQGLVFSDKGILYSSEHGPTSDDELNIIKKAKNYGWEDVMGYCDLPSEKQACDSLEAEEPIAAWTPTEAPCGIAFYRNAAIPEWDNTILMAFLKQKQLKVMHLNEAGDSVVKEVPYFQNTFGRLREVLVLDNGRIFLATSNTSKGEAGKDQIVEIYNPGHQYPDVSPGNTSDLNNIYPNPAKYRFHIVLPEMRVEHLSYSIFSINGILMKHSESVVHLGKSVFVDVSDLENGFYIIQFTDGTDNVAREKFQVLR